MKRSGMFRPLCGPLTALCLGLCLGRVAFHSDARADDARNAPACEIRLEEAHAWRPPFGLDRIGRPLSVVVSVPDSGNPPLEYVLVGYCGEKEVVRSGLILEGNPPHTCRVSVDPRPTELALFSKSADGTMVELARRPVEPLPFEADAVARPDRVINPVDLGAILPPADWLLLAEGQKGTVEVAAISRDNALRSARVTVWFESAPSMKTTGDVALTPDRAARISVPIPPMPTKLDRDILHVSVTTADAKERRHELIPAMLFQNPPHLPAFGAFTTKLRYDAPISVRRDDRSFGEMDYATAWDPKLHDVVVALPGGARFVFWRGSSYIPFWAGKHNTGFCYEWAETNLPGDACDAVEPLMDKELHYGRVRIVESTSARIHVRWSYQSCDFNYKTWGDSAVEDFYFYPDGFGTRVLTLQAAPEANYELSELIVLTPPSAYPLDVLPPNLVDILFLDRENRALTFPFSREEQGAKLESRDLPAVYRIRMHKDEPSAAIYFNPLDRQLPQGAYGPFFDQGRLVTPVYWGSHWPLARGKTTGGAIDDRVAFTPCHNSILTWGYFHRPDPVRTARFQTLDAKGRSRVMQAQTWVWMIGMSNASDAELADRAQSFARPPVSAEIRGARLAPESYSPERRAIRLVVEADEVRLTLKPYGICVGPVFELTDVPATLARVQLGDRTLEPKEYAWDGKTLWIGATLSDDTALRLEFE